MNEKIEEALVRAVEACPEAMAQIRQAVLENWYCLEDVPEPLRTQELCTAAVRQNGCALEFVPWPMRTQELCEAAVRNSGEALASVPSSVKTEAMCMEAVKLDGLSLRDVPDRLKTPEMCLAALQEKGCLEDWEAAAEQDEFQNTEGYVELEDISVNFWDFVPASMQDEVKAAYEEAEEAPAGPRP